MCCGGRSGTRRDPSVKWPAAAAHAAMATIRLIGQRRRVASRLKPAVLAAAGSCHPSVSGASICPTKKPQATHKIGVWGVEEVS